MYTLRLYHDCYAPGTRAETDLEAQHSIAYVLKGSVVSTARLSKQDSAVYVKDVASVAAGPAGATVWRWELVRTDAPNNLARGDGIASRLRMSRRVRMFELVPTSKWLFRLDCIYENRGSTGLHSHPGSGIRCMLEGHLRVESDKGESSDNRLTGDCWYEEGSYPLISTSDAGRDGGLSAGHGLASGVFPLSRHGRVDRGHEIVRIEVEELRADSGDAAVASARGDGAGHQRLHLLVGQVPLVEQFVELLDLRLHVISDRDLG